MTQNNRKSRQFVGIFSFSLVFFSTLWYNFQYKDMGRGKHAMSKKAKRKKIGRPNRILYWFMYHVFYPFYHRRYGLTIDAPALRGIKGPAIVLAAHTSNKDHWLMGMALYPTRPNFVVSEHFTKNPALRPLLRIAHVITKKMFSADVATVMNMLRAVKEGNTIVLFPEGRLSCNGRTTRPLEGTAALLKKLGVDVYTATANGAALTFPKWGKAPRRGRIRITGDKLFSKEELATLSLAEIDARVVAAIRHDDFAAMPNVPYATDAPAAGLDRILYRCPKCGGAFKMMSAENYISCSCGFCATLDEEYILRGAPFSRILEWYDWQEEQLDLTQPLACNARIGAVDEKGNMDTNAGHAHITLDRDAITFAGTVFGKDVSFARSTEVVTALPVTVGEHFDLYHNNTLYYIYPEPDPRTAVMWVSYLDRVTEERRQRLASGEGNT